jgi:hypothetical protein
VLFGHIGDSLAATAQGYHGADAGAAQRIQASGRVAS